MVCMRYTFVVYLWCDASACHAGQMTTYGSISQPLIQDIVERTRVTSRCTFVDLGSGVGQCLVQVAATTGCRCIGIELVEKYHLLALKLLREFDILLAAVLHFKNLWKFGTIYYDM